jgi:broad specificity phosphatase PhoE
VEQIFLGIFGDTKMTELWILRHATTQWNIEKRFQGSQDIPLCSIGEKEASSWKSSLENPDWIFSSPMKRAIATAEILYPEKNIILSPELRELSFGEWEGKILSEVEMDLIDYRGLDFAPPNGESLREAMARIENWLHSLESYPGRAVVITHKMTIHGFYSLASGWDAKEKPEERLRFPKIHKFIWDGNLTIHSLNESLGDT